MSMRPIALVTHRYAPAIGGVERVVEHLARGLARRGIAVEVITTDPTRQLSRVEQRGGVLVRRFPTLANDSVYYVAPRMAAWLKRNAARFALIHAHSYHTALAPQAALAAWGAGTPLLLSPYYHGGGHTPLRRALHLPYRVAGHWMVRQARRLIYISEAERALFERHFGPGQASLVAPCGVEIDQLLAAQPHARPPGRKVILAVGRLEAYKQADRLVTALPLLPPEYELVVIGSGPQRSRLDQLAVELGVRERLRLLDHVSQPDLLSWYRSADVFASLSRHESFGMTLLEGAAAGAPIVASDIPAHREVAGYAPADRAIFVDTDCAAAELSRALELACRQGRADDSTSWRLPSWDGMVDALAACYQDVIGDGASNEFDAGTQNVLTHVAGG
ncbi:MAG TPA: glycosyltransferase family 4 protein [Roseiflexaceae bacterium]|nr:glycosyltransferase family 4 protein [Roseiflexaceae bacterium]